MKKSPVLSGNLLALISFLGFFGIAMVIISQNAEPGTYYVAEAYFPYILIVSLLLILATVLLKVQLAKNEKRFSVLNIREFIRVIVAIAIVVYALFR